MAWCLGLCLQRLGPRLSAPTQSREEYVCRGSGARAKARLGRLARGGPLKHVHVFGLALDQWAVWVSVCKVSAVLCFALSSSEPASSFDWNKDVGCSLSLPLRISSFSGMMSGDHVSMTTTSSCDLYCWLCDPVSVAGHTYCVCL